MKLDRKTRRTYSRFTTEGKRMTKLNFLHPEKVEQRRIILSNGNSNHEEFVQSVQERIAENNSDKEAHIMSRLKEMGLTKKEIDNYLELWSSIVMWPKLDNHIAIKKEFKSLCKKYNFYA